MIKKLAVFALFTLVGLFPFSSIAMAQQPQGDLAPVVEELAAIRQSLDRLVGLLDSLERRQQVDLLMKRIEMKERRLAPLEQKSRQNLDEQDSLAETLTSFQSYRDGAEEQLDDALRSGDEQAARGSREELGHIEAESARLKARLELLRGRGLQIEADLIDGRRDVKALDDRLVEWVEELD
jgi:chromosome segregation ATPase